LEDKKRDSSSLCNGLQQLGLEDEDLLSAAILGERVVFGEMKIASQKKKYLKTGKTRADLKLHFIGCYQCWVTLTFFL
jgi:hypothetical protein